MEGKMDQDKAQRKEELLKKFSWDEYVKKSQADTDGTEEFFRRVEENDRRQLLAWERWNPLQKNMRRKLKNHVAIVSPASVIYP